MRCTDGAGVRARWTDWHLPCCVAWHCLRLSQGHRRPMGVNHTRTSAVAAPAAAAPTAAAAAAALALWYAACLVSGAWEGAQPVRLSVHVCRQLAELGLAAHVVKCAD